MLRDSKDAALAYAAERFVNTRLRGVGQISDLSLETTNRTVHFCLTLRGESEPVDVKLSDVEVQRGDDGAVLIVGGAVASREWLSGALGQFVVGRTFPIPRGASLIFGLLT